jgi:membrane-bound ClpP family serine protease
MAMGGTFFLFKDESGQPVVNYALAGTLSIVCGQILWSVFYSGRFGKRRSAVDHHQSVVGLIGTVLTEIEIHGTGSVDVEGEIWVARSDQHVAAGCSVRVMRQDGGMLTVKEVKKFVPDQQ